MTHDREFSHLRSLPLSGLTAFEAAVRLGNFRRAADELCVTHSAISHRVRQLEERLGAALFERHGNRVTPTALGRQYFEAAIAALGPLRGANEAIDAGERRLVRVAVMPMLGIAWLAPRLSQFGLIYPHMRFEVHTIGATDAPGSVECDLVIHYGPAQQEGARSVKVFSDRLYAVGAPDFVAGHGPFRTLDDFLRVSLVRYSLLTWPAWLGSAFGHPIDPRGSYFDDAMTVLEAVAAGLGLTVITRVASEGMLRSGRLVLAHPHGAQGRDYHATLSDTGSLKPAACTFFDWLTSQSAAHEAEG